ncbi:MAG: two component transcriptional regulator, winged helix family, partial [Candidatus Frackibacter sp. T328-2]
MSEEKILVVDDEENILELIKYNLTQDGYQVSLASDGQQVLEKLKEGLPDLIILDIMLPGLDGFEICRLLQDKNLIQKVPIVFLSAKTEIENKVRGLELGATDYLTKPFSPRELTSRVRAIFRRLDLNNSVLKGSFIEYGRLTLDLEGYRVLIDEQEVEMTNK